MINNQPHIPVMLSEVLQNLQIKSGETYVDATFGAGGYSTAILQEANCKLIAFDRDKNVIKFVENLQNKFGNRFNFINEKFSEIENSLHQIGITEIDGLVMDIGVSSMQLDNEDRGFSFDSTQKLDMRMDQSQNLSAFEVVNEFSAKELADIIYQFGDEIHAKKIANKIVELRKVKPIYECRELANIVRGFYRGYFKTDPATKTFQALRIFVNKELEELEMALQSSLVLLKKGGRLVVVSFHSLEDRIVKNFLKKQAGIDKTFSRYEPEIAVQNKSKINFKILTKSALMPSQIEIENNPRSRSAKMRVAIKL